MQGDVLNTAQTSEYIGLAVSTLEKARVAGTGPRFIRMGRAVRYRRADLDGWMAERVVGSTSERVSA